MPARPTLSSRPLVAIERRRIVWPAALAVAALALLLTGCARTNEAGITRSAVARPGEVPVPATGVPISGAPAPPVGPVTPPSAPLAPAGVDLAHAMPTTVRIPAIRASAPMIELGLEADGNLEAPRDYGNAGWYTGGPRPGELGPAVVAAHVDSNSGPAPFYRLREVQPGTTIFVDYDDGSTVTFNARRTEQHPKGDFPSEEVYGNTAGAELRLITCGGSFNHSTGHYRDNVIVFAELASSG